MMKKPKIVYFIAFSILGIVLSLPVQSALLYENSFSEISEIFSKISHMNWLMAFVLTLTSISVLKISPTLKVLAPISIMAVGWNNYLTGHAMLDYSLDQSLLGAGLYAGLMLPLTRKDIRELINHPEKRWWARSKRVGKVVPVTVNPFVGSTWQTKTYDLSETGAFIAFEKQDFESLPKVGDEIKVNLNINSLKKIRCEAIVVRVVEPKGIYPRGMGIRFTKFTDGQKKNLAQYLDH